MPHRSVVKYIRKPGSTRGTAKQRERLIQRHLTRWMRSEYPDIDFYNDWASGAYLTQGQNMARMSLASRNGWVDLFIAEPVDGKSGYFLELKREDFKVFLKDGKTLRADPQLLKEYEFVQRQRQKGYAADIVCGLENAKRSIDTYLNRKVSLLDDTEF